MRLRLQQGSVRFVEQAGPAQCNLPRLGKIDDAGRCMSRLAQVGAVDAVCADADVDEAQRIAGCESKKQIPVFDA